MKLFLIIMSCACLSACHTVAGMGKDITKSAEWTSNKLSGDSKAAK